MVKGLVVKIVLRSKTEIFNYVKDKVWKNFQEWKKKILSYLLEKSLIKAVAQAIPTCVYFFYCWEMLVRRQRKSKEDPLGELVQVVFL